jgi:hypothetical protein
VLRDASATIAAVRTESDSALDQTVAALPATLDAAQTGGAALTRTITRLRPLTVALTPGVRGLAPTLTELQPLLRATRPVLGEAVPFVSAVRTTLSAAQRATPPTTALIKELTPLLENVNGTLVPFLKSPSKVGVPIYRALLAFASSADGTMSPVQTPQQSGRNGSGHFWHVFARFVLGVSGTPPCSGYGNAQLSAILLKLELCTP